MGRGNQALKAQFRRQKEVNRAFSAECVFLVDESWGDAPGSPRRIRPVADSKSKCALWRGYIFPSTSAAASLWSAA